MEKEIIVNNLLISYTQSGGGQADFNLLFLHGWRSNKLIWSGLAKKLLANDSRLSIYALDFPGFGKSQTPPFLPVAPNSPKTFGWKLNDFAEIVAEFIVKLELRNVIIVGHSFGGRVGIKLASQHPGLVSKLVLVDSAGFAMDPGKKSLLKFMAKLVRPAFKPKVMQGLRRKIYKIMGAEDYVALPEMKQTFLNVINEDLSQNLGKIKAPTLIVWGKKDKATPVEFGRRMQSLINSTPSDDRAKFFILKGAGHFSFLDQPGEFIEILSDFMFSRTLSEIQK